MNRSNKVVNLSGKEPLIDMIVKTTRYISSLESTNVTLLQELIKLKDEYVHGHYFEQSTTPIEGRPRHSENTLMDYLELLERINRTA